MRIFLSLIVLAGSLFGQAHSVMQTIPKTDTRKVLVVFGDSISAGYGLAPGQSFPDVLQRRIDKAGYPWRVVNLGISGDTTQGGVSRITTATSLKPAMVLLELGGNDAAIFLKDAILDNTHLDRIFAAIYDTTGQICKLRIQ